MEVPKLKKLMRKLMLTSAALAALALGPGMASADVVIAPEVDTWVIEQPEVPNQPDYNCVVVDKKRFSLRKRPGRWSRFTENNDNPAACVTQAAGYVCGVS